MSSENHYFRSDYEEGIVIKEEGEWVVIELPHQDSCHSCGAKMLCRPNESGQRVLRMPNTLHAKVGDKVLIEQIGKNQFLLTLMQFGLPMLFFLLAVILGDYLLPENLAKIPKDILLIITGLGAIILSGVFIYLWSKWQAKRGFSVFRLVKVLKD